MAKIADLTINITADTRNTGELFHRLKLAFDRADVRQLVLKAFDEEIMRQRTLALRRIPPDPYVTVIGGRTYFGFDTASAGRGEVYVPPKPQRYIDVPVKVTINGQHMPKQEGSAP